VRLVFSIVSSWNNETSVSLTKPKENIDPPKSSLTASRASAERSEDGAQRQGGLWGLITGIEHEWLSCRS
jgi:hypothetical protein